MKADVIARMIDHTLLKPDAVPSQVEQLCREAAENGFFSVCINPTYVPLAAGLLADSDTAVCTVVGFPLGAHQSAVKAKETELALNQGANEIDMVLNIGALKSGDHALCRADIQALADLCKQHNALLKVILETCLLSDEEKKSACGMCVDAGADFVKTSTGFSTGGATVDDIRLMSNAVSSAGLGVKASGGIRTYQDAVAMIEAGATRIGASSSLAIVQDAE